jgi:hypothetical protein
MFLKREKEMYMQRGYGRARRGYWPALGALAATQTHWHNNQARFSILNNCYLIETATRHRLRDPLWCWDVSLVLTPIYMSNRLWNV